MNKKILIALTLLTVFTSASYAATNTDFDRICYEDFEQDELIRIEQEKIEELRRQKEEQRQADLERIERENLEFEQMELERAERRRLEEEAEILKKRGLDSANDNKKQTELLEKNVNYYLTPDLQSGIDKFKKGDYTGCIQELFSLTELDPSNAAAFYYMGMAYTYLDSENDAIEAYEKVISLNSSDTLVNYATIGKDCLTNGPACPVEGSEEESSDPLDEFVNSPYGNGLSPELNLELKQKELGQIETLINNQKGINKEDYDKIKKFDKKSENISNTNIVSNEVSDNEILQAIETLKRAGLSVNIQSAQAQNDYSQLMQNSQMNEWNMLMGNNQNANNNSMNALPYLMQQQQNGQNIDPQLMQAMMMNSMTPNYDFTNNQF
ncbi:MAG: tetratricopeptide repeat protein [Candidatus Gastranaerophilales bacterium]